MMATETRVQKFFPGGVRVAFRQSVREPLRPDAITLNLHGESEPAEVVMTVRQALALMTALSQAVEQFCERRDVAAALARTDPLGV